MLKDMKTRTHLKPGQKGTKRLVEQFGDKLICVRYRFDEKRQVRLKTVEIIVDERPCIPGLVHHVMARGIEGRDIFRDDDDRQRFLQRLADEVGKPGGPRLYAWALEAGRGVGDE